MFFQPVYLIKRNHILLCFDRVKHVVFHFPFCYFLVLNIPFLVIHNSSAGITAVHSRNTGQAQKFYFCMYQYQIFIVNVNNSGLPTILRKLGPLSSVPGAKGLTGMWGIRRTSKIYRDSRVWIDVSVVKSTCCFCKRLWLVSQHPYGNPYSSHYRDPLPSSGLHGYLILMVYLHLFWQSTYTHKIKLNKF